MLTDTDIRNKIKIWKIISDTEEELNDTKN